VDGTVGRFQAIPNVEIELMNRNRVSIGDRPVGCPGAKSAHGSRSGSQANGFPFWRWRHLVRDIVEQFDLVFRNPLGGHQRTIRHLESDSRSNDRADIWRRC
jgi:hypothetical protein